MPGCLPQSRSMRADCPHCGAKLTCPDDKSSHRAELRCWMCTKMVTVTFIESGPPTITKVPRNRSRAAIIGDLKSQTTSLALPRDKIIVLHVVAGASQGMEWEVFRPLMTIGRVGGEADIRIEDAEVSSFHCAVEVRREELFLHDLRSRNGTYLNEVRVFAAALESMSQFRIGSSLLQIRVALRT
jgi:pSer/pThr/pTyr-binding forkhead associated (FHA) protein